MISNEQAAVNPRPQDLIAPLDFIPHWDESVTEDQYHADRTSVGSTQIRRVIDSAAGFYDDYYGDQEPEEIEEPKEEEDHFTEGRMIHMAILEPDRFKRTCVVMPEFWGFTQKGEKTNSSNCKEVKEKRESWLAGLPTDATICTRKQIRMITGIAKSLMKHPQVPNLMLDCAAEVTGYYRDPETGIKCRFRPDLLKRDFSALNDVKSARSTNRFFFGGKALDLRYDIQLYMYIEGTRIITGKTPDIVTTIAAEKKRPYEPAAFWWNQGHLIQAGEDYHNGLRKLRKCIDENHWPFRQQMIEEIYIPKKFIDQSVAEANV